MPTRKVAEIISHTGHGGVVYGPAIVQEGRIYTLTLGHETITSERLHVLVPHYITHAKTLADDLKRDVRIDREASIFAWAHRPFEPSATTARMMRSPTGMRAFLYLTAPTPIGEPPERVLETFMELIEKSLKSHIKGLDEWLTK